MQPVFAAGEAWLYLRWLRSAATCTDETAANALRRRSGSHFNDSHSASTVCNGTSATSSPLLSV